jgi:putative hemolysin
MAENIWLEIVLILLLILINGFFSGAEIAVVSSRRGRLQELEGKGKKSAFIVNRWLKAPEDFLATVQVGITVVGVLGSAVGGATAIEYLKPAFLRVPWLTPWAETAALTLVVVTITFLTLILGELVPKSLALSLQEKMACWVAWPIYYLSRVARPIVVVLTWATRTVLLLLGRRDIPKELFVSEEEIRFLIREGASQGVFDSTEQQLIPKVFDFANMSVRDVMLPREKIVAMALATPKQELFKKMAEEGYTRVPVFDGTLDRIIGILHMKDLIYTLAMGDLVVLQDLVRPAVFVLDQSPAKDLLLLFQKKHLHMAVAQDNLGRTVGIVTLEDLLERIVGDIKDEHDVA